jgi:hypothetical protein|tara:strand:+ start:1382 stop:2137 length:756 start_codon:yes stop_codon:yes gene_type:complete
METTDDCCSDNDISRKTIGQGFKEFIQDKEKYKLEYTMLKYSAITFLLIFALEVIGYLAFFRKTPNFMNDYGWWILYTNLTVVSIGAAIWHFKSYKAKFNCMLGMMIGMTFGMQVGMMIGTILGATNGLFIGGTVGMIIAEIVGIYTGNCCGIMGVLEGMMAGVMGGVMGGMIGTMFVVDNILLFMPFFMISNLLIMWGTSYMLFEEVVEDNPQTKKQPIDFTTFFSACLIITVLLVAFIVYGPKTGLAAF